MATSDVRWFTSEMLGAPVVDSSAGTVKDMLKTVLTLGFNQHNVSSVVIDGTGLATVTTATAHGFPVHSVVKLEGSDQAVMNDDWRVTATDEFTFQFQTESPDLVVTGTMTVKFAPVPYWSVQAEEGNHIAFKSLDPTASGKTWVVEDDGTTVSASTAVHRKTYGWFSAVENFVDFTTPKIGRGHFWTLVYQNPPYNTRPWAVFADSRFIYFVLNPSVNINYTGYSAGTDYYTFVYAFGDINSFRPNDTDAVIVMGSTIGKGIANDDWYDWDAFPSRFAALDNTSGKFFVRSEDGQSTGVACAMFGFYSVATGSGGFSHPEPVTQKTIIHDIICRDSTNMRGTLPGAKQLCHTAINANGALTEHEDRVYYSQRCHGAAFTGEAWIDIVGPWR